MNFIDNGFQRNLNRTYGLLFLILASIGIGIFSSISFTWLVFLIIGIAFIYIGIVSPTIVLAIYALLCSEIFRLNSLPMLNLSFGSISAADLCFLLIFVVMIIRLNDITQVIQEVPSPIMYSFALWVSILIASTAYGYIFMENDIHSIFRELRVFAPYFTLPLFLIAIKESKCKVKISNIIIFIGCLSASVMLLSQTLEYPSIQQYFHLLQGSYLGNLRTVFPGEIFMLVGIILAFYLSMKMLEIGNLRRALVLISVSGLCFLGLLPGWRRWYWFTAGLLISWQLYYFTSFRVNKEKFMLALFLAIFGIPFLVRIVDINAGILDLIFERMVGGFSDFRNLTGSMGQRVDEWKLVKKAFFDSPIIGLGLGAFFDKWIGNQFSGFVPQLYVHSMYLWIILKTGILGALSFFCLVTASISSVGIQTMKRKQLPLLGGISILIWMAILIVGIFESGFSSLAWSLLVVVAVANSALGRGFDNSTMRNPVKSSTNSGRYCPPVPVDIVHKNQVMSSTQSEQSDAGINIIPSGSQRRQ